MNCIAVIEPKKNTTGTARACTASQRTVKIGYVYGLFVVIGLLIRIWWEAKLPMYLYDQGRMHVISDMTEYPRI